MESNEKDQGRKKPNQHIKRKINPHDISLPKEYTAEVFAHDLTTPINMIITPKGDILLADAGITDGNGKVLRYTGRGFEVIADGFNPPLTGINYYEDKIYVSHRGVISTIDSKGKVKDILVGLPSYGDHHNNQVIFDSNGKMYFGQGTATNSGVVGEDNEDWVKKYPFFHDYPGSFITLNGYNFKTPNFLTESKGDNLYTGAFSPIGVPSYSNEVVKGITKASGSILRANPDGTELELIAFGLRNPFRIKFDRYGHLYAANHGMDVRGSRPIANSPDELLLIYQGNWYGWPDYTGGQPVTSPVFKPENRPQPQFLLSQHPMVPPSPFATFTPHSAIMGFDFNYNSSFGPMGDAYIAEFGSEAPETTGGKPLPNVGHRVSRIDMTSGIIYPFAVNKSGFAASYSNEGGFERPIDVVFDSSSNMYVVDFGLETEDEGDSYAKKTGVIWKISKR